MSSAPAPRRARVGARVTASIATSVSARNWSTTPSEVRENLFGEEQGAVGARRVREVHGETARALLDDLLQRLRDLRGGARQADVAHRAHARRVLQPFDLALRLRDQDAD